MAYTRSKNIRPIFLDFETQSEVNLKKVGAYRYFEHPSTRVICLAYWRMGEGLKVWMPDDPVPECFYDPQAQFVAHNANFDRLAFNRFIFSTEVYQWRCTMARALSLNLPGKLSELGPSVGAGEKSPDGKELLEKWSKKIVEIPPEELRRLVEYCSQDVRVMVEVYRKIGLLHGMEQAVWEWDQGVNDRGFAVDQEFAESVQIALTTTLRPMLLDHFKEATGTDLKPTQRQKFKDWFLDTTTFELENTRKAELQAMVDTDSDGGLTPSALEEQRRRFGQLLPPEVVRAFKVLLEFGKSSLAKFRKICEMVCDDMRIRGGYVYHHAHTGRWAGRGVQPQNLPKEGLSHEGRFFQIKSLIELGMLDFEPSEVQRAVYNELTACIRPTIMAEPGRILAAIDFSNVEARVLAWLAGEDEVLQAFRDVDAGTGAPDVYELMASAIYKIPAAEIKKTRKAKGSFMVGGKPVSADSMRALGKAAVLGCGYGMGDEKFIAVAKAQGSKESSEMLRIAHQVFRAERHRTVALWSKLKKAASDVLCGVNDRVRVGPLLFTMKSGALRIQLPSGRKLHYQHALTGCVCPKGKNWCVCHDGRSRFSWGKQRDAGKRTYQAGHITVENVVQAIARDLSAEAALRTQKRFPDAKIVLHSHDELVYSINSFGAKQTLQELTEEIARVPEWAKGLPIAAEGWIGERYKK